MARIQRRHDNPSQANFPVFLADCVGQILAHANSAVVIYHHVFSPGGRAAPFETRKRRKRRPGNNQHEARSKRPHPPAPPLSLAGVEAGGRADLRKDKGGKVSVSFFVTAAAVTAAAAAKISLDGGLRAQSISRRRRRKAEHRRRRRICKFLCNPLVAIRNLGESRARDDGKSFFLRFLSTLSLARSSCVEPLLAMRELFTQFFPPEFARHCILLPTRAAGRGQEQEARNRSAIPEKEAFRISPRLVCLPPPKKGKDCTTKSTTSTCPFCK